MIEDLCIQEQISSIVQGDNSQSKHHSSLQAKRMIHENFLHFILSIGLLHEWFVDLVDDSYQLQYFVYFDWYSWNTHSDLQHTVVPMFVYHLLDLQINIWLHRKDFNVDLPGFSTLITSAPKSANVILAKGPWNVPEKNSSRVKNYGTIHASYRLKLVLNQVFSRHVTASS